MNNQPDPAPADRAIAALIDHTILKAEATRADVVRVCREALEWQFASVCVNGFWVPTVTSELEGSAVKVCAVVGFPLGAMAMEAKRAEAEDLIRKGAQELDMVLNIGALRSGDHEAVREDISLLAQACHDHGAILKVILETAALTPEEKRRAAEIAVEAGADFLKTSTGFHPAGGATVADVELLRQIAGPDLGVKASGGIRTIDDLRAMVAAGANRIGASASVAIVTATSAGAPAASY